MASTQETLIQYLRDAYAMEQEALSLIDRQLGRLESYPDFIARLRQHRDETERQAERLEVALHRLGADTSAVKTVTAKLQANMQAFATMLASDEVMKDLLSTYTFEQWEIVNYKVLAETARIAGQPEVQRLAEESLREEEEMFRWVDSQVPVITQQYLARESNDSMRAAR